MTMKKAQASVTAAEAKGAKKAIAALKRLGAISKTVKVSYQKPEKTAPKPRRRRNTSITAHHADVFLGTRGPAHPIVSSRRNPPEDSTLTAIKNAYIEAKRLDRARDRDLKAAAHWRTRYERTGDPGDLLKAQGLERFARKNEKAAQEEREAAVHMRAAWRAEEGRQRNPPTRRRNIAGKRDENGVFHPFRYSTRGAPYDPVRAGDVLPSKSKRKPKRKPVVKRATRATAASRARQARATTTRRRSAR